MTTFVNVVLLHVTTYVNVVLCTFLSRYPVVWKYMQAIASRSTCPQPYTEALEAAKQASTPAGGVGGMLGGLFGGKK